MTDISSTHNSTQSSLAKHPAEKADTPAGNVDDAFSDHEKQTNSEFNPNNVASTAARAEDPKAGKLIFILLPLTLSILAFITVMTIITAAIPRNTTSVLLTGPCWMVRDSIHSDSS